MKEIDQRNKNSLLIECNCGFQHYLDFSFNFDKEKWEDSDEKTKKRLKNQMWKHYCISFVEKHDKDFWMKLKDCWNYLFTRKGEICYSGIGITSKDMEKIIKHFRKYQAS